MESEGYKAHCIKIAGITALVGNGILAAVKIIMASISGSLAVMGDGIDSSTDVLIAIVTLFVGKIISMPSDKEHPWGHGRAETTATMALAFIIFFAGAQLVVQSLSKIIHRNFDNQISTIAVIATVISIVGKIILALTQYHYGKLANSDIVIANAHNMKNDIIMSSAVLLGLAASQFFHCPALDSILAFAVGLWVIKNAVILFQQMNMELMDGNSDKTLYKKLFDAVASVRGVTNPHSARIRKISSRWDIDLDIEMAPSMPLYEAHELAEQVEEAIRKAIPDIYAITIHVEPLDSDKHQRQEEYGLSPSTM